MNDRPAGMRKEKGARMIKTSRGRMSRIGSAGRRGIIALTIAACSNAAIAYAQTTSKAPNISDIRLMRKLGDTGRALEYVKTLLADGATSADVRQQAYNELVTIAFVTEGMAGARSAAQEALMEFPDLKTDPAHHPEEIQRIYDSLRNELFGLLHLASDPSGCAVSTGSRKLGSTPIEGMYFPLGDHILLLEKPDYADDTIHVAVAAGAELKRFVAMHRIRGSFKRSIGFEASSSIVSMQFDHDGLGDFAGLGPVDNWKNATRFGGGVFLQTYIHDRLAIQIGARYSNQGNTAKYDVPDDPELQTYDLNLHYLAVPAAWKIYPLEQPRIFGCLGIEPAYLFSANLTETGGGRSIDIIKRIQRLQVSLIVGAGCEVGVGGHYLAISAYRIMGQMSLKQSTYYGDVGCKTREWKISLGFLL